MKRVLANVPKEVLSGIAGDLAYVGDADALVVVADAINQATVTAPVETDPLEA
jgi:hypothetical protein